MIITKFRILFILSLLLSFTSVSYSQVNVKDSIDVILHNDTLDIETRFRNAYNLVFYNSSPEEAKAFALDIVYPFVEDKWEDNSEHLSHLARLYLLISFCYRERGGEDKDEKERYYAEKALETAKESEDDAVCARCSMACAYMELKRGDEKQAHEYLYQAISHYDKLEMYSKSSEMLYVIVGTFFDIKDTDGMKRVLGQMEENLEKDSSKQSQYQYNVIKHFYYDLLLDKQKKDKKAIDYQWVDSSMLYINRNIYLVDNHLEELDKHWMHAYAYYFLAKELDKYYPEQTDSIHHYLDKAIEMREKEEISRMNESSSVMELNIYINQVRAQTLFREGKIRESYQVMSEALSLLDELGNYNNLNEARSITYQFMIDYYEQNNRPAEALRYSKLLHENDAVRFENEKIQVMNEMSAKYETEKKEIRIQNLIKENKAAQRILWLTIGLSIALLFAFLLTILFGRLKRKNIEQRLYETALHAELRQNELEKIQNIQQQLEQNPIQNTMEKVSELISISVIEKEDKKKYLERIPKIDAKLLQQVYQTAKVKITNMDMKYIICFAIDMDVKDISLLFNIEPASVHTVRYRIKKKFSKDDAARLLL